MGSLIEMLKKRYATKKIGRITKMLIWKENVEIFIIETLCNAVKQSFLFKGKHSDVFKTLENTRELKRFKSLTDSIKGGNQSVQIPKRKQTSLRINLNKNTDTQMGAHKQRRASGLLLAEV